MINLLLQRSDVKNRQVPVDCLYLASNGGDQSRRVAHGARVEFQIAEGHRRLQVRNIDHGRRLFPYGVVLRVLYDADNLQAGRRLSPRNPNPPSDWIRAAEILARQSLTDDRYLRRLLVIL